MIPICRSPSCNGDRRPPDPNLARLFRRLLIVAIVAVPLLALFWHDVVKGLILYLFYLWAYLNFPVTAIATVAAIVFAVGWYLPLPFGLARLAAWKRATIVTAVVVVLHSTWFLVGWTTFYPTCRHKAGVGGMNDQHTLVGQLEPAYADQFERKLIESLGGHAVNRSEDHTILIRPIFGLLESQRVERISEHIGAKPMPADLAGTKYGVCRAIERNALVGRRAVLWRAGWGLWPWNTIHDDGSFARWLRDLYRDA